MCAVLLVAGPAWAQEPEAQPVRASVTAAVAGLAVAAAADLWTTHEVLALGGRELNPLMRAGTPERIAISSAAIGGFAWLTTTRWGRERPRLMRTAALVAAGVISGFAVHNWRELQGARAMGCGRTVQCGPGR